MRPLVHTGQQCWQGIPLVPQAKIKRCVERADDCESLSRKQIEQNMRRIDKNREKTCEIISDKKWGDPASYDLTINTTDWEIKTLAPAVAEFAICRFGGNHANPVI